MAAKIPAVLPTAIGLCLFQAGIRAEERFTDAFSKQGFNGMGSDFLYHRCGGSTGLDVGKIADIAPVSRLTHYGSGV